MDARGYPWNISYTSHGIFIGCSWVFMDEHPWTVHGLLWTIVESGVQSQLVNIQSGSLHSQQQILRSTRVCLHTTESRVRTSFCHNTTMSREQYRTQKANIAHKGG